MGSTLSFLIDECVTPELRRPIEAAGHYCFHVRDLGLTSASDHDVARAALTGDRIVVTNNGRDYRRIYRMLELHPGLIVILPQGFTTRQIALFEIVLAAIDGLPHLVNTLIEVDEAGQVTISDWPPP